GCVWVMVFDPEKTKKAYNIPDEYVPVAFLMLGYPAEDAEPSPRHAERLSLEETVFYGEF
ncbi:MAG: nitroreductase, partial [Clostridia bacterium]|nr:nitroreductase [Clostridia bacterium]